MQRTHGGRGRQVRSLFLSDVHLGSRHSQCRALLHFLENVKPRHVFIVGDLIDGWQLKRSFRWLPMYSELLKRLTAWAEQGTRVCYLPGNHDAFVCSNPLVRDWIERLGCIEVAEEMIFETADRRRFLVTHGDRFDAVEQSAQWLSIGVTGLYDAALSANWWINRLLRRRGHSPYRMCARIKDRIKAVIRFISRFEDSLIGHAKQQGCQGVICGHLHTPAIVHRDGVTYCNTGDWVENCTALVEYDDGSLKLEYYYPTALPIAAAGAVSAPQGMPCGAATPPILPELARPLADAAPCAVSSWRAT